MHGSSINVCEALDIIEWEISSHFCGPRVPLSNTIGLKATLLPSLVFLNGMRKPDVKRSVATIGIGIVHNFITGEQHRAFGLLQRCGVASLLVNLNRDSVIGPALSILTWQLVSVYGAEDSEYPFKQPSTTGQTWLDRETVGPQRMLQPGYDPDGILPTIMTGTSMWFGRWCATSSLPTNERSVLGLSLISLGYMSCYAFPKKYPFSQTFWTLSYAVGTSGFSLLKWTMTDLACRALSTHSYGSLAVDALDILGSHTVELYVVSTILDQLKITSRVRALASGWRGKLLAVLFKNAALFASAVVINKLW